MTTRVARVARALAAGVLVVAVLGVTAWVVLERGTGSDPAEADLPAVTAVVEARTLRDVVVVRGTLRGRPLPPLIATGGGRVTAVRVTPGAVIDAGDVVFDVHAEPVIAVAGAFPYWRSLERGAVGADVRQLEEMLATEGLAPGTVDDRFSGTTRRAVTEWQRRRGLPADGVFRADRVLVAGWPVRVQAVDVVVGASIGPDQELLTVSTVARVGEFRASPANRASLAVGQAVTVTLATGGPERPGTIVEIAAAPVRDGDGAEPSYPVVVELSDDATDLPDGAALRGDVLVAEAVGVLAVPVAAVRSDAGGAPAVRLADGESGSGEGGDGGDSGRRLVPVELGLQEAGYVEVTSGLAGGERVVLELE